MLKTVSADIASMPPPCTPEHIARRVRRMAGLVRSAGQRRADAAMSLLILDEMGRIFPIDGRSETIDVPFRLLPTEEGVDEAKVIGFISSIVRTMRLWRGKRIDAIVLEYNGAIGKNPDLLGYLQQAFLQEEIILSPDACVGIVNGGDEMWIAGRHGSSDRVPHVIQAAS